MMMRRRVDVLLAVLALLLLFSTMAESGMRRRKKAPPSSSTTKMVVKADQFQIQGVLVNGRLIGNRSLEGETGPPRAHAPRLRKAKAVRLESNRRALQALTAPLSLPQSGYEDGQLIETQQSSLQKGEKGTASRPFSPRPSKLSSPGYSPVPDISAPVFIATTTTTRSSPSSSWPSDSISMTKVKPSDSGKVDDATRYYYPPKQKLPLPQCFYNPAGYVCCNPDLNKLVDMTYAELRSRPKFHNCNLGVMALHLQKKAEKTFNTSFETIAGLEDFAQKIHFHGDLVCKSEINGRFLLVYATAKDASNHLSPDTKEEPSGPRPRNKVDDSDLRIRRTLLI